MHAGVIASLLTCPRRWHTSLDVAVGPIRGAYWPALTALALAISVAAGCASARTNAASQPAPVTDPLEGWLRRSALRLSSLDDAGEALARLDGKLADRQVVLVGEPDHFIHEKYAYRLSIIRHLFARGFRLVGMEMGRSDAQRIDRYIETGDERWLDRVALYGYRGDLRTDRKPPAKSMFAARNQVAVDAYRAEERRFAHALRVISESRPASTPRLRFFGYDVDMLPGGGYADLDELLAPAASNPVVAELRARLRRVDGESAEAERARLVDAAALVWSRARELTAALSAENFVEVKATLTCLGESLLYAGMTEGEPDAGHLLAALRRREETMFWQVDTALARDSGARAVLLGHNLHLTRDEHALREIPSLPAWTWPRLGSHLVEKWGDKVAAIWLLYARGAHSDLQHCDAPSCPIASAPDDLGARLAHAGPAFVVPSHGPTVLDEMHPFLENGNEVLGRLARVTDYVVFVESVHGLTR